LLIAAPAAELIAVKPETFGSAANSSSILKQRDSIGRPHKTRAQQVHTNGAFQQLQA
jgi:hypothetical protein